MASGIRDNLSHERVVGIFGRGLLMGIADTIPGVSGGTIALITGIYPQLLHAIRSVNRRFAGCLVAGRVREALNVLPVRFLIPLFTGIATAIILLSGVVTTLLSSHPMLIKGLFLGMVAGSAVSIVRKMSWSVLKTVFLIAGIVAGYAIELVIPSVTPNSAAFMVICGFISIIAMLLPGISGAYILLLMGKYEYILKAVHEPFGINSDFGYNIVVLGIFASGCIMGLLFFSRLIGWLLKHFRDVTLMALVGLMIGTLKILWPWQGAAMYNMAVHNVFGQLVLPSICIVIGFAGVLLINANEKERSTSASVNLQQRE